MTDFKLQYEQEKFVDTLKCILIQKKIVAIRVKRIKLIKHFGITADEAVKAMELFGVSISQATDAMKILAGIKIPKMKKRPGWKNGKGQATRLLYKKPYNRLKWKINEKNQAKWKA